jgi:hypothetical protein
MLPMRQSPSLMFARSVALIGACVARSEMLKVCADAEVLVLVVVDICIYIRVFVFILPRGVEKVAKAYGDSEGGHPQAPIDIIR